MENDIIQLLRERLNFHTGEADKCRIALNALTGGATNGHSKGADNGMELLYSKNAPAKEKVKRIIESKGQLIRKKEIVEIFLTTEKLKEKDATDAVTNALSNLKKDKVVLPYKPKDERIKGGYWGLYKWFANGEPLSDYHYSLGKIVSKA